MAKRCVRCASCVEKNGVKTCSVDGAVVSDEDRARFDDGKCWTKIVPKKKTRAEISALRSKVGRLGGLASGQNAKRIPRIQIQAHKIDRDVLFAYGQKNEMTIVGVIHHLCRVILQNHPDIKKPDGWID